jgi:hypothetical protein
MRLITQAHTHMVQRAWCPACISTEPFIHPLHIRLTRLPDPQVKQEGVFEGKEEMEGVMELATDGCVGE